MKVRFSLKAPVKAGQYLDCTTAFIWLSKYFNVLWRFRCIIIITTNIARSLGAVSPVINLSRLGIGTSIIAGRTHIADFRGIICWVSSAEGEYGALGKRDLERWGDSLLSWMSLLLGLMGVEWCI